MPLAIALALGASACQDQSVIAPRSPAARAAVAPAQAQRGRRNAESPLRELAQQIPELGGYFFDDTGNLGGLVKKCGNARQAATFSACSGDGFVVMMRWPSAYATPA